MTTNKPMHAPKTGMWITEDFGTRFKLMAGIGQVIGFYDTIEQAREARAAIAKAEGK